MPKRTATCPECGATFEARQRNQYFCTARCRKRVEDRGRRPVRNRGERTCEWCAETFQAAGLRQRFCGPQCRAVSRCAGLSSPIPWRQCEECEGWFVGHGNRLVCSRECDLAKGRRYRWAYLGLPMPAPLGPTTCPECGTVFTPTWHCIKKKYCSPTCTTRATRRYRKAIERTARRTGERFTLREIAERDGWRCHLCHRTVSQAEASLDHLDPVSLGGAHTKTNVALAHRKCNSARSNRGPAQLRLIA